MKKFTALLLALLMVSVMAVPVFAGASDEADMGKVAFEIQKENTAWKADGTISDGEYYEIAMKDSWFSYAWNDVDDNGEGLCKGLGQKLYMSWDDQYVYVAATYTVPAFYNTYGSDAGNIWQACAIQNNFALKAADVLADTDRLEYGLSLTSDTNELVSTVWADASDGAAIGWTPTTDDYIVTNNNNLLTYESRTPWTAFYGDKGPGIGGVFGFCIVWAAGGENGYLHAQLASGCTGNSGKKATNFAQLTLAAAPVVETEAPATEAPAAEAPATTDSTAPQTADIFAVVAFAGLVTAFGAVVLAKKRER
jgi:hypothetical protein